MTGTTKKGITMETDEKLLSAFYWVAVRATHEVNSKRGGPSKSTREDEAAIMGELIKRFNLNEETFKGLIFR